MVDAPRYAESQIHFHLADGSEIDRLVWTNADGGSFRYVPERLTVSVDLRPWREFRARINGLRLELPSGWLCEPATWLPLSGDDETRSWTVYPREAPGEFRTSIRVYGLTGDDVVASASRTVRVESRGYSQFDPAVHAIPLVNRASRLGNLKASREVFDRTYALSLFPSSFFERLYGAVVHIGAEDGQHQGGLCTGMARVALERSLTGQPEMPSMEDIMLWHGRQLSDTAAIQAAPWFLSPSPRRAFERFRTDVETYGWSDVCFDIGVPRLGHRKLTELLDRTGHTVVPVAYRQEERDRAEVLVYDPNYQVEADDQASVITFDLAADTYAYRHRAQLDESSTTIFAVRQDAYRSGRTAILASLFSLLMGARDASLPDRSRLGGASLLVIALTLLALVGWLWRRSSDR